MELILVCDDDRDSDHKLYFQGKAEVLTAYDAEKKLFIKLMAKTG